MVPNRAMHHICALILFGISRSEVSLFIFVPFTIAKAYAMK